MSVHWYGIMRYSMVAACWWASIDMALYINTVWWVPVDERPLIWHYKIQYGGFLLMSVHWYGIIRYSMVAACWWASIDMALYINTVWWVPVDERPLIWHYEIQYGGCLLMSVHWYGIIHKYSMVAACWWASIDMALYINTVWWVPVDERPLIWHYEIQYGGCLLMSVHWYGIIHKYSMVGACWWASIDMALYIDTVWWVPVEVSGHLCDQC